MGRAQVDREVGRGGIQGGGRDVCWPVASKGVPNALSVSYLSVSSTQRTVSF